MKETLEYRLLDCGDQRRLEQFGPWMIDRPAPGALFPRALSRDLWEQAQIRYVRGEKRSGWHFYYGLESPPSPFPVELEGLRFQIRFSENGQLGIYPEQQKNWRWLQEKCAKLPESARILNGFAYTGGSTLAASLGGSRGAGCEVCHLDSSKSSVNWARDNQALNGLEKQTIRFIVEDMLTFMDREIRRGRRYQGMILDPPAFGRAPGGKTWEIQRDLPELLEKSAELMDSEARFFLLSCHDREISAKDLGVMLKGKMKEGTIETLDLSIPSEEGNDLPNGCAARWLRN